MGVYAKDVGGVLDVTIGDLGAAGDGQNVNALTLILLDSDNVLLFPALLLPPVADEADW